jgi:hypothetical protein
MRQGALTTLLVALAAAGTHAGDLFEVGGVLEGRAVHEGDATGWLDGGLGKTRFGGDGTGLHLSHAALLVDVHPAATVSLHVHANLEAAHGDDRLARAGLAEAFAAWSPDPATWLRVRSRAGLFFPPISLEHRGEGWTTTHTLTPSALNSWIGEEVRTVGAETRVVFVARDHEVSLVGSVFDVNDPAGTLLHWRGFALHDRQTVTGDHLPLAPISPLGPGGLFEEQAPWVDPVRKVDGNLGWYVGSTWRQSGRFEVSALRWDNRGVPTAFDGAQYAWYTEFDTIGARLRLPAGLEVQAQRLVGETEMGAAPDGAPLAQSEFHAAYVLLTASRGRVRVTARYDEFEVEGIDRFRVEDDNDEDGEAWTAAVVVRVGERHEVFAEWLRVDSERPFRADLGLPVSAREDLLQAALRLRF